jgi:hypothetical protein
MKLATHSDFDVVVDVEVLCLDAWVFIVDIGCTILHSDSTVLQPSLDPSTLVGIKRGDIVAQVVRGYDKGGGR